MATSSTLQLPDPARAHLDSIVHQMTTNGENDTNIQNVVNDFKTKYSVDSHAGVKSFINTPTPKVSVGKEFLKGLVPAAAQTVLQGPAKLLTSVGEGIDSTVRTGGKQNASGKTYNVPLLGSFKSFQSDAVDRAKQGQNPALNFGQAALGTAGAGLDTVGAMEGAKGATSLVNSLSDKKAVSDVWDMIKPELTKTSGAQAGKSGSLIETGISGKAVPKVNNEMIDATKDVLKGNESPLQATSKLTNGIKQESESLKSALKGTKTPWSPAELMQKFKNYEPPITVRNNPDLENVLNNFKTAITKIAGKADQTNAGGLLDVKQQFADLVEKAYGETIYDKQNPVSSLYKDVYHMLDDSVVEKLPDGLASDGTNYKASMRKQTLMFDARDNAAAKIKVGQPTTIIGKAGAASAKYAAKTAGGLVGTGAAAEALHRIISGSW